MKIVITVEEFDPDKGYLEYYLARELTKLGHEVCIFTFGWSKRLLRTTLIEGFEVISVPHVAIINNYHMPSPSGVAYIIKFVKIEKPDIIHCQPLFSPLSLLFIGLQRPSRHRIVGSLLTGTPSTSNKSIVAKLKYNFVKTIIQHYVKNKVDLFFAINDGWKKVLSQLLNVPHQKISIVPLGADSKLFKFDEKARIKVRNLLGLYTEDVVVVYSGKIIPSKELHILVKAISPIVRQNRKVKLIVVGKGDPPYIRYLKDLCLNLKISNNVIFYPWVHRTRLPDIYSASDIAVWPGAPSISIVEAAAVGLPVIVIRSAIMHACMRPEYENCLSFTRGNIQELTSCLETLICNAEIRLKMGLKSRKLIKERYNWEIIASKFEAIYNNILDNARNRYYLRNE